MQAPVHRSGGPRRWCAAGLTLSLLSLVIVVGYRRQAAPQAAPRRAEPVPVLGPYPVTLVPGVHLLGGLDPAAAYVVETSEGLVLIDAGLERDARLLRKQMAALGLDWRRIRAIFLTHVHGDHCGGAQYLRQQTGAKIYAGKGDAAVLRAGGPRAAFFGTFPRRDEEWLGPTTVDVVLDGDQEVVVGGVRFVALATPGHTPGSVCYLMEKDGRRILFSGDVIMALGAGEPPPDRMARPLGTYSAYQAPRYRGDAGAFLATLRWLRTQPAPDLVLPGHPRRDTPPRTPVMSQRLWATILDRGIREMEQLQARYARDGANFLDGTPKQLLPGLSYLGDLGDVAVYGLFSGSKFFVVNAPGPDLPAFLEARLRKLGVKPAAPAAVLLTAGGPKETAGLTALVEQHHLRVVATKAAWEKLKRACPPGTRFLPAEELPGTGWFPVEAVPLAGRGVGQVTYRVRWAGKAVLFTGRIPIVGSETEVAGLLAEVATGRVDVAEYHASLRRLDSLTPDLWLPAIPCNGQNANLYDSDWATLLKDNGRIR